MARFKWFDRVHEMHSRHLADEANLDPLGAFDFASLVTKGRIRNWFGRFLIRRVLVLVLAILRVASPVLRLGRLVVVSRYDDAITVLQNDAGYFPNLYGQEMEDLGRGTQGVLGLEGAGHDQLRARLERHILPGDYALIGQWARLYAEALIEAGNGEIDVARDLITRVATETCCRYFGINPVDPDAFAEWAIAVSTQLFADPFGDENARQQARIGSIHLAALVDDAIARVQANNRGRRVPPVALDGVEIERHREASLIDRLITYEGMAPDLVRATIAGMATGFVPTNALAAGNMLEELLERPRLYDRAVAAACALKAARAQADEPIAAEARARLQGILLEAARFNPALSPGVWRHCPDGGVIQRADGRPGVAIRPGSIVMVSILSALRDNPDGTQLIFGWGPHSCMGSRIALEQIVETFAALLSQPGLARSRGKSGWMQRAGVFPVRFDMRYDCTHRRPVLLVAAIPVRWDVPMEAVKAKVEALGFACRTPGDARHSELYDDIAQRLTQANTIQFASINVIEAAPGSPQSVLLVEVNGDGSDGAVLATLAEAMEEPLRAILTLCAPADRTLDTARSMAAFMLDHVLRLHQKPWGSTGLHFNGLPGLTVADIARQDAVARWARDIVDLRIRRPGVSDGRAIDVLTFARRLLRHDPHYAKRSSSKDLMDQVPDSIEKAIIRPGRIRPGMADWTFKGVLATMGLMLASEDNRPGVLLFGLMALVSGLMVHQWALPAASASLFQSFLAILAGIAGGLISAVLLSALGFAVFLLLVRMKERKDVSDPRIAPFDHVQRIAEREDIPGYEQNHIIALMPMKPGVIRRISFAFSMWWIREAVTHWFRPGFVATMGTIHKARWFLVPGTRQFVFHSNYDGSWESYLEDFITRVHQGQSSAWSHGVGFPDTRFLVMDGAADGDRFKRWVRRQQQPTQFWYSRFPRLTAKQIRRNAMIEDGLARAVTDTDARRWLANFGSAQREVDELESQEAQAIVFSGLKRHQLATALAVRLPETGEDARSWLDGLLRGAAEQGPACKPARIGFGDLTFDEDVLAVGFSAAGLERLGLSEKRGLGELPAVFRMGMHGRSLLGDPVLDPQREANTDTRRTRWNDNPQLENGADAVLMIYTPTPGRGDSDSAPEATAWQAALDMHGQQVAVQKARLQRLGGNVIHEVPCQPVIDGEGNRRPEIEHFGFRDGISQPAIRGSRQARPGMPVRDLVAPGEFLLGYRNDQGYVSPSVQIGAEYDGGRHLPTASANQENRYPWFGSRTSNPERRDFGRNGAFLVLRQLDQDVESFNAQLQDKADSLLGSGDQAYKDLRRLLGRRPERGELADWLGAKIIGRWRNGSPLVGNPSCPAGHLPGEHPDNDFAYGIDDPRGFSCPLGSHIRRTNPRDSQEPGDPAEQAITNRHRLLRRGRTYCYTPEGEGERKGLLFGAVCSDIERQFEFVQHTWINATSFHGLSDESDPLLGNPMAQDGAGSAPAELFGGTNARFTIPTADGPIVVEGLKSYVTYRGGGYFMLPSRSALIYLVKSGGLSA